MARQEIGDRGSAIYASKLRPLLDPQYRREFVAIDVETEDYEVASDADVCVIWDDQPKFIRAQVLDEPLMGTRMLSGHDLQACWEVGGQFRLSLIPPV